MNKVETKKNWYDKPIRFLFFFLALLPIFMTLGNYISCQIQLSQWKTKQTIQTGEEEKPILNGDGDINSPQSYKELGYNTPIETAIFYTNAFLCNWNPSAINDGDNLVSNEKFFAYKTPNSHLISLLDEWYFKTFIYVENSAPEYFDGIELQLINAQTTLCIWSLYEIQLAFYYIILKVALFLPNVICYLLDWVERRLGKL